jgi:hypothetical protein
MHHSMTDASLFDETALDKATRTFKLWRSPLWMSEKSGIPAMKLACRTAGAGGRSIAIGRAGSSGRQEALGNALRDARERTILDVEAIVCN